MLMSRKSRYALVQTAVFVVFLIAIIRLFFVQIIDHRKYVDAASALRVSKYSLLAKRGEI